MAHLLCKIVAKLRAVGLMADWSFELPLTQAELADATGLSTVHVNRTLQELRANGLIRSEGRTLIPGHMAPVLQGGGETGALIGAHD